MIQTTQDTQGNVPTQYILLKSHHINKTISHKSYGLYSNEEEAYAAALVQQMQSIEETSKKWPRNVIDEHWQNIHTLCKYMKENLTSFKERFEHFHTMTLFAEHCPVSYQVIPLLSAADNLLNESLFKTKTRNFMDAFQSTKTDEEVDLANSEDDDDEDDDEFSGEDGSGDDDGSSSNGEEDIEETEGEEEEEDEEDGDDEEEDEEEEQNENTQLDEEENENSLLEGDGSENLPAEENENSLLEEDESENPPVEDEGEEQVENPVPETEEEDQINEEQTDEEGFEDEEQINRGIKRSRSVVEEDEEDEIDEDELAEDEDEPITRKRKIEE
ncbi:hypothetical protein G6F56_001923 [Rhizopus delemar]|nr:hypothetical protein G6F56_001923 [Rhizopus delemar]